MKVVKSNVRNIYRIEISSWSLLGLYTFKRYHQQCGGASDVTWCWADEYESRELAQEKLDELLSDTKKVNALKSEVFE